MLKTFYYGLLLFYFIDAEIGSVVTNVSATDVDSPGIQYRILSGDEFLIDTITGSIFLSGYLDREAVETYSLSVLAVDSSSNTGLAEVIVTVIDVNDNSPQFEQSEYQGFVSENSLEGEIVLLVLNGSSVRILATDFDEPNSPNSLVQYGLQGVDAARFNINSLTGIITVAQGIIILSDPTSGQIPE